MPYIQIHMKDDVARALPDTTFRIFARLLADATVPILKLKGNSEISVAQYVVTRGINVPDIEVWGIARKTEERMLALQLWTDALAQVVRNIATDQVLGHYFIERSAEVFCVMPDAAFIRVLPK